MSKKQFFKGIEQIIEVDEKDNIIGLRFRDQFYTGKYIHRSSHLILLNSKNEILLQQRAKTKEWYPNLYAFSVSGTVANETYEDCIRREMKEEIGIETEVKSLIKFPVFDTYEKAWHCVFISQSDKNIIPDLKEIQKIVWMNLDVLKDDLRNNLNMYTPAFAIFMNKYFFNDDYKKLNN
jgi:isopentenyl-diphosphate Delta-isomerase